MRRFKIVCPLSVYQQLAEERGLFVREYEELLSEIKKKSVEELRSELRELIEKWEMDSEAGSCIMSERDYRVYRRVVRLREMIELKFYKK